VREAAKVKEQIKQNITRIRVPSRASNLETQSGEQEVEARKKGRVRELLCTHCDTKGRSHLANTHNTERCFYLAKENEF